MKQATALRRTSVCLLAALLLIPALALAKGALIGIYPKDLSDAMRTALDYEEPGILIVELVEDGGAMAAGVEVGDILQKVDDTPIHSVERLTTLMKRQQPGTEVDLLVVRKGKEKHIKVTLTERKTKSSSWTLPEGMSFTQENRPYIGIYLEEVTDELAKFFGHKDGYGILISGIAENSPAESAKLEVGDLLVGIDEEDVHSVKDLHKYLGKKEVGDEVTLHVIREKKERTIKLTLGERNKGEDHGAMIIRIEDEDGIHTINTETNFDFEEAGWNFFDNGWQVFDRLEGLEGLECLEELEDLNIETDGDSRIIIRDDEDTIEILRGSSNDIY